MLRSLSTKIVSRIGITPVGSAKYRVNRLRFHLLAYVIARRAKLAGQNAEFIIRCDDTDTTSTNRSFLDAYLDVLFSLGVKPSLIPYDKDQNGYTLFQSERGVIYQVFVDRLMNDLLAYKDPKGAIIFDTEAFAFQFRHLLKENKLSVIDVSMGNLHVDIRSPLNDAKGKIGPVPFPLVRSNGQYLFNLCSPVDDAVTGVTHVVRDRDKLDLLAKQEMVRISLGFPTVEYVHAPLLINKEGRRFVNDGYYGEATFQDFVARGILPKALVSYLLSGFIGPSERYYSSIDEFSSQANFSKLHQTNTLFDPSVLEHHNKRALVLASDNEYVEALNNFLSSDSSNVIRFLDKELLSMLTKMRRSPLESRKIIESLSTSQYDMPNAKHIRALNKVLTLFPIERTEIPLGKSQQDFLIARAEDRAKSLGLSKKEYYQALRYILTGKYHGCSLHDVLQYLEKTDTLNLRLEMAKQAVSNSEVAMHRQEE